MHLQKELKELVSSALQKNELTPAEIPRIDLYMDQILTLFDDASTSDTHRAQERTVTKTMINNYTKERLIMPVKGKKYTREQMMQLLCVLELKQTLPLSAVKLLMEKNDSESFETAINRSMQLKARLREKLPALLDEVFSEPPQTDDSPLRDLVIALTLSSGAGDLRRICEGMVEMSAPQQEKKK